MNINQKFDKIQMILMMKTSISNNRISRLNKKDTRKTKVNCCSTLGRFEQTVHLVWVLLWPFFEKQVNVQSGSGNISMLISSHMEPTAPLQRTAGKATSKNMKFSFLEDNRVQ